MKSRMLKSLKIRKSFTILLTLLALLFCSSDIFAKEICWSSKVDDIPKVCFPSDKDAGIFISVYKKWQLQIKETNICEQEISECSLKAENLKDVANGKDAQLSACKDTVENLTKEMDIQKESYKKQIDEIKPSLWDKIKLGSVGAVIGAGLVLVAMIL